jgi:TRAP-type mannitol/chloroaromatic compound transport system permease large subunit
MMFWMFIFRLNSNLKDHCLVLAIAQKVARKVEGGYPGAEIKGGVMYGDAIQEISAEGKKTAGDLKGLQIRATGPSDAKFLEQLQATPVAMPMPEAYLSLQKGVLDGVLSSFGDPEVAPPGPSTTWKEKMSSLRNTWSTILIFALVIGGIYVGVFTPTEAGAIGASGALTIGLINPQLTWSKLVDALLATGRTVSMLFLLLFGAMILGYFMAASEAPLKISEAISNLPLSKYLLLTAVLLVYVFLGCVMNILPAVIITLPIFFPAINGLGFDPIWFGVILVIIMEMGLISPPVGMNVFVIQGIAKDVPLADIYRAYSPSWWLWL